MEPSALSVDVQHHLVFEFRDSGARAVEFLLTARDLLSRESGDVSRLGETMAYCLREAMVGLLDSIELRKERTWSKVSKAVVDAKRQFDAAGLGPAEDLLVPLFDAIDEMASFHDEVGLHERQLVAVLFDRTGLDLAGGTEPVRRYTRVIERLNKALHGSCSHEEALVLWNDCVSILNEFFLPPVVRYTEIRELAGIEKPIEDDLSSFKDLVKTVHHLEVFVESLKSPAWLILLTERELLQPPSRPEFWPLDRAIENLRSRYSTELVGWLKHMFALYGKEAARAWQIARIALKVQDEALDLVLAALQKHPGDQQIVQLAHEAAEVGPASSDLITRIADHVLNEQCWSLHTSCRQLFDRLVDGLTEANARQRIQLLCQKLQRVPGEHPVAVRLELGFGKLDNKDSVHFLDDSDRFSVILEALTELICAASPIIAAGELLPLFQGLPNIMEIRLRAFALAHAGSSDRTMMIDEIAHAIINRPPTAEDVVLVDRITLDSQPSDYWEHWSAALELLPSCEGARVASELGEVPDRWKYVALWSSILPREVTSPWRAVIAVLVQEFPPSDRDQLKQAPRVEAFVPASSPFSEKELEELSPMAAARLVGEWTRSHSDFYVNEFGLAGVLELVVAKASEAWLVDPEGIVRTLREPVYVSGYLDGIKKSIGGQETSLDKLLDVVQLVFTCPWEPAPIAQTTGRRQVDWTRPMQSALDVVEALIRKNTDFGDRADEVWGLLEAQVRKQRNDQGGERSEELLHVRPYIDSMGIAISRISAQAFQTLLLMMGVNFNQTGNVRQEAVALLEWCLAITGEQARPYREIIGSSLRNLEIMLPDRIEEKQNLLFGVEATDGLGQLTVDAALSWGRTSPWLMQNLKPAVLESVERGIVRALDCVLEAMLYELPGYSVRSVASYVFEKQLVEDSSRRLGHILTRSYWGSSNREIGIEYWRECLRSKRTRGLEGFGSMCEVAELPEDVWCDLTLATLKATGGQIRSATHVGERVGSKPPTEVGLEIMDKLIRGENKGWNARRLADVARRYYTGASMLRGSSAFNRLETALFERNIVTQ